MNARENLDERGLTRPILTDYRVDLAGLKREVRRPQSPSGAECFRDVLGDKRVCHR
jgi:hypothetical protein